MLPMLPLVLALAAVPTGESAVLVDIRAATAVEVRELKHDNGVHWWLELGNSLLLAGDVSQPASRMPVLGKFDNLQRDELALRAVGCAVHEDVPGQLIARGGRWQLRRLAPGQTLPYVAHADERWRAVQANEVIARQYRLDAPLAAPADSLILPLVQHVSTARWFADVSQLASWDRSSFGTSGLFAARDWIGQQFADLGLVVSTPDFSMRGPGGGAITRQNVIGQWTGTTQPDQWVIVGAHYDSRNANINAVANTPGAEDNASGCAGVIEMARAVLPSKPQRSVLFMCYAGEEQGLDGSYAHVEALHASGDLGKVHAVIIMDMIGYSADDQLNADLESYATWLPYLNRFGAAAATYAPELNVVLSTNAWGSDHVPYLDAGKQTLLTIESDYDIYPHYHKSTDTPDHMGPNAQAMGGAILKTNVAMLAELSGASDRIFSDDWE